MPEHAETAIVQSEAEALRDEMLVAALALDLIVQAGCDQSGNIKKVAERLRRVANQNGSHPPPFAPDPLPSDPSED